MKNNAWVAVLTLILAVFCLTGTAPGTARWMGDTRIPDAGRHVYF